MTSLFKRKYRLTVGKPTLIEKNTPYAVEKQIEGVEFVTTDHQITFQIEKSNTPSNNTASITVYNASDRLTNFIEQNAGLAIGVKLEVSYGSEPLKLLFLGTVQGVVDEFTSTDRKTKIKCSDGYIHLKEQRTSRSFPKGTTLSRIVDTMVGDLGLPRGTIIPPSGSISTPRSYMGTIREIMTTIANDIDYNFSVQDSRVNFTPFSYNKGPVVKVISPRSGMIGSPTPLDVSTGQLEKGRETKRSIKVKCLIDASVKPDGFIIVESRKYNGTYKVNKVSFSGDYEGSSWEMDIECEEAG